MDISASIQNIFFDHPYQQHASCCWSNTDNVDLKIMKEEEITIKDEPIDEVSIVELKGDSYIKQECEENSILSLDILNSIKNELEQDSSRCCDEFPFFNDEFNPLNVIQEEVIIKSEPTEDKNYFKTLMTEEIEDPVINNTNLDFSVIKQEGTIKFEDDFHKFHENQEENNILAEQNCHCFTKSDVKDEFNSIDSDEDISDTDSQSQGDSSASKSLTNPVDKTETPYKCEICNYKSLRKRILNKHLKLHKKKCVVHKCNKCEYTSLNRRLLQQHFTTHVKAYKCTKCKYRASRQLYLDVHMKTHVNSSFKCYQCEYTATQRSTVTRHFNEVHMNV